MTSIHKIDLPQPAVRSLPRLLCVDDDEGILAAVTRLLKKDFQIFPAASAEAAIELLNIDPDFAVVLTDHRMGGMTGLELLTKVEEKAPDAVRVVFSGHIPLVDMADAINSSRIHRFIYKPWDNAYLRVQMLEALATHLTFKERRALAQMSVTDPLTQIKNRRFFEDCLKSEIERADRHTRPLSLLMIDIDHFKKINDHHGHQAGDALLFKVAQLLQAQLRSIDIIARYGGEEFAILLPETNLSDAVKVAERIRTVTAHHLFLLEVATNVPRIEITISLGCASVPENANTPFDLIAKADQALYQAKRQGRNQSVSAS